MKSKKVEGRRAPQPSAKPPRAAAHDAVAITAGLYAMDPAALTPIERSNLWNAAGAFIGRCQRLGKEVPSGKPKA